METWKPVNGYEDKYAVSSEGRVRSLDRTITNKNGKQWFYPGKILKPDITQTNMTAYARVTLSKEHKTKRFSIHRLVAEAFHGPAPDDKPHVNHIDNNGSNNTPENLEWCSHSENMQHAQRQGRLYQSQSTGGKRGSATNLRRLQEKVASLTNTWVNDWFVHEDEPVRRKSKYYLRCECRCGRNTLMDVGRLYRREASSCVSCGKKMKI